MTYDLTDKDENTVEKKDQSIDIVNIEDLDSDDVPIGQRLAPGIDKRSKNRKGQAIESSNMPFKSLRKRASDIVSTSRKQVYVKKIPANIPEVPIDNISFHSVENVEKWKFVYQRILALIHCEHSKECDNKRSKDFRKVEITTKQVKEWPRKGKLFASALSVKYVVLHRIEAANWVPTNDTFSIATGLDPIAFPPLICGVILSQHSSILISSDNIYKRDPPLSLHFRLFTGKHVPYIVLTSTQTSYSPTTRTCILAELKDSCKTLDETIKSYTKRKSKIKMLIKALSKE
ncbi:uncharacterized protein LOC127137090 [Lathyrus oleraceus]|uniref:uncharacterized protein LOC127137090 n=1 Tax=Pisum sativum TaxID=3888 RepID=UPI0021CDF129|nr:uncharacterized protein LOC127137090 [Pisum sativum]